MLPDKRFTTLESDRLRLHDGWSDPTPEFVSKDVYIDSVTLDQYKLILHRHDWLYAMSDDPRVYNSGRAWGKLLTSIADRRGEEFQQAYNLSHQQVYDKSHFAGTYIYPYPEVAERMAKLLD